MALFLLRRLPPLARFVARGLERVQWSSRRMWAEVSAPVQPPGEADIVLSLRDARSSCSFANSRDPRSQGRARRPRRFDGPRASRVRDRPALAPRPAPGSEISERRGPGG